MDKARRTAAATGGLHTGVGKRTLADELTICLAQRRQGAKKLLLLLATVSSSSVRGTDRKEV